MKTGKHEGIRAYSNTREGSRAYPDTHEGSRAYAYTHEGSRAYPDTREGIRAYPDTREGIRAYANTVRGISRFHHGLTKQYRFRGVLSTTSLSDDKVFLSRLLLTSIRTERLNNLRDTSLLCPYSFLDTHFSPNAL